VAVTSIARAVANRRLRVKRDGRPVYFTYNATRKTYSVVIDGVRHQGTAGTVGQARDAVRKLLGSS